MGLQAGFVVMILIFLVTTGKMMTTGMLRQQRRWS